MKWAWASRARTWVRVAWASRSSSVPSGVRSWTRAADGGAHAARQGSPSAGRCWTTTITVWGWTTVFRYGLDGLATRAHERIFRGVTPEERGFLGCMIDGINAQLRLAERFAEEADFLLVTEDDPVVRARLERIAVTMRRIPAKPPETFYEGLATILFMRETTQALEGNGISISRAHRPDAWSIL